MHRNMEGVFADLVVSLCAKEIPCTFGGMLMD
jgi:hypothetical protein